MAITPASLVQIPVAERFVKERPVRSLAAERTSTKTSIRAAAGEHAAKQELAHAARSFESLFLQMLLRTMRESQLEDGMFGGGTGAETWDGMFDQMVADSLADTSPLGIADDLIARWTVPGGPDGGAAGADDLGAAADLEVSGANDKFTVAGLEVSRANGKFTAAGLEVSRANDKFTAAGLEVSSANDKFTAAGLEVSGANDEIAAAVAATSRDRARTTYQDAALPAGVSSRFGARRDPIDGSSRFHAGTDIQAPAGTPVLAVAAGTVRSAGSDAGYGISVVVEHPDGWTSRYAHLESSDVRPGDHVPRGSRLGVVGATGRATGPHLHFETRRNGLPVDPGIAAPGPLLPQVLGHQTDER